VPLERGTLRVAVDLADVRPGERLLDVGTGTGALLREVARRGAGPALVIGVDRSPRMLSEVGGLPESRRIVVADARALPFADATFDVITLVFLLHLLRSEDRAHVLDATRRALRPAGRVVSVMVESRHPALRRGLGLLPAWTGLRRLDPRADMRTAGLRPERARHTERW
jgi:ubiquinone/menaquinone biosynthesis C-methylase UbiE